MVPDSTKSARAPASSTMMLRRSRSSRGCQKNVTTPASAATATSRQSEMPTGGMAPMRDVAQEPTAQSRGPREHEDADEVEPLAHRG
ncbi:hypothetical protein IU11_01970 [Cellulosimicrobium sp. MM]|nr:hypothetical protein IU11_01970 [Cellulosimicrobium sp. MM]